MVTASTPPNAPLPPSPPAIVIRLDDKETGESFGRRFKSLDVDVARQPTGTTFYTVNWDGDVPRPTIKFEHGQHSFSIPHLSGLSTGVGESSWAIQDYDLYLSISPRNKTPHEVARQYLMGMLKMLQSVGWRQFYERGSARFLGRSSFFQVLPKLDARYVITPEEWLYLGTGGNAATKQVGESQVASWSLHANGIYMAIDVRRQIEKTMPAGTGAYLISMNLMSEKQHIRENINVPENGDWKPVWANFEKLTVSWRKEDEAKALAKGLKIDTAYQDPPILALEALKLRAKVSQPAPKAGMWKASSASNNAKIWDLAALQKSPARSFRQGDILPSLSAPMAKPQDAAAQDTDTVWTWVKE